MEGKITRDVVQDVVNEVPELLVSGEDNLIFHILKQISILTGEMVAGVISSCHPN
jgi:hypothetical protein